MPEASVVAPPDLAPVWRSPRPSPPTSARQNQKTVTTARSVEKRKCSRRKYERNLQRNGNTIFVIN